MKKFIVRFEYEDEPFTTVAKYPIDAADVDDAIALTTEKFHSEFPESFKRRYTVRLGNL